MRTGVVVEFISLWESSLGMSISELEENVFVQPGGAALASVSCLLDCFNLVRCF